MSIWTMGRLGAPQQTARGITPWDPSSVFLVKSLLYPLVATACLGLSVWLCGAQLKHEYFLVAVLGFLATSDVLDTAPLQHAASRSLLHRSIVPLTVQWLIVVGFIWALIALSDLMPHFDPNVLLTWAAITPVALWLSRLIAQVLYQTFALPRLETRKAVIIGHNNLGELLAERLRGDPSLRIEVLGFFDDAPSAETQRLQALNEASPHLQAAQHPPAETQDPNAPSTPLRVLGETAALPRYIVSHGVQLVYITWPMAREARILALLELLRDSTVSIYFVPDVSVASLIQGRVDLVNGIPVVGICESPFFGIRGLVKRACDIIIASVAIVCAAPIFLFAAIGVRLSSPGPIIFKQRRYGLDGKEILVYKFRSMTVTEDGDRTYKQVVRNDSRVTPFGAFIRKTSIDELPQLFNVLEGSMSLVGPRPHAVAVNEQYRRLISGYMVRHKVKPGITGWAQVNGLRGGDDLDSMRRRVEFDLEYLRNWSLGLDLAILLKTVALVFNDRRAY
jgi:putative colanic acid biosynthesis UDP-glucose lipid carrier transferase